MENLLKITFTAYIAVEVKTEGLEQAKDLLDNVTDLLITELRKKENLNLSGTVDWISPAIGARNQSESPSGQVFVQQLDIVLNVSDLI